MKQQRNLDGVYFRIKRNGQWGNVCFTDLEIDEVYQVLENKDAEWIKGLVDILTDVLQQISDVAEIDIEKIEIPDNGDKGTYFMIALSLATKIYAIGEICNIVSKDE